MINLAAPDLGIEEKRRLTELIDTTSQLTRGPAVEAFESEFAAFCNARHGIATSNGTTALHTALAALELGPGDRVATSPFSFIATANAIRWCGAEPVFIDIDPDTYTLHIPTLEQQLQTDEQIDAVLAVHCFGLPCDMDPLLDLAETHNLAVIEDAAQAHGARYRGEPVGAISDVGCFSFFPSKNMTTGEGGMIVTDRDDIAKRARSFIHHGRTEDGYEGLGHNFAMTDLLATIGQAQLEKLPEYNKQRRANAHQLTTLLNETETRTPIEPADRRHVYHQYTIQTDKRDDLQSHLAAAEIQTKAYYETPIHQHPAYDDIEPVVPTAERLSDCVLSLPVHPHLSSDDLEQISTAIQSM